eukprot:COSAG01_NODE_39360_length_477_cov_1.391534_2_plen_54_part_01
MLRVLEITEWKRPGQWSSLHHEASQAPLSLLRGLVLLELFAISLPSTGAKSEGS